MVFTCADNSQAEARLKDRSRYARLFHRLSTTFAGAIHSFVNSAPGLWRYHATRQMRRETLMRASVQTLVAAVVFGLVAGLCLSLGARAQTPAQPDYAALLAAPDRSAADRQADKRRDPLPFLAFAGARPGMKVLDMGAGGGYSTELVARAVAPNGVVLRAEPGRSRRQAEGRVRGAPGEPGGQEHRRRRCAVRRSGAARRARSRSDHVFVLLPRHHLHERRPRRDGPQAVRGAQARRLLW